MILKRFFQRPDPPARTLYAAIVAAARHPAYYADWGIADTLDGRFDMIALHAYLVLERLKGTAADLRQELVDELFLDMDRSLREMGVSDVSVGKKVRKMAEVFYGRVAAYDQAIGAGGDELKQALGRNVYPDGAPEPGLAALVAHVEAVRRHLSAQAEAAIVQGQITFPEPRP